MCKSLYPFYICKVNHRLYLWDSTYTYFMYAKRNIFTYLGVFLEIENFLKRLFSCIRQRKITDTVEESFICVAFHKVYTLFYFSGVMVLHPSRWNCIFLKKTQTIYEIFKKKLKLDFFQNYHFMREI